MGLGSDPAGPENLDENMSHAAALLLGLVLGEMLLSLRPLVLYIQKNVFRLNQDISSVLWQIVVKF